MAFLDASQAAEEARHGTQPISLVIWVAGRARLVDQGSVQLEEAELEARDMLLQRACISTSTLGTLEKKALADLRLLRCDKGGKHEPSWV